jgi:Mg-chelatase subunit ChlD
MKIKILGIALFGLTLGAVVYYPQLMAKTMPVDPPIVPHITASQNPKIDVVFVLDTTGSMSGLIQTAKEKIWSIATTMASAQQTPEIRVGLVAYRDRGDAYVTKVVDLSDDLDSVYATLMDFQADGGGDGPESVNKALYDAVHNVSWSASAAEKGIVVNTIQCGDMAMTIEPWTQIAALSNGSFFQVEQAGGAVAFNTPFDDEIAELSAKLDDTRLYYGTAEEKKKMHGKVAATVKLNEGASVASRARRGAFNASVGGRANLLGENELVAAIESGKVDLDELEEDVLPETLKPMAPEAQAAYIADLSAERQDLQRKIQDLSKDRNAYLEAKVEEAGGMKGSLDQKLYDAVKEQAGVAGLEYEDGPAY